MTTPLEAYAVIDGAVCQLGRLGTRMLCHAPIATAIVEFRRGPLRTYVREHPFGLLPGIPNLYCVDGANRLLWMAEWPDASDPCAAILDEVDGELIVKSVRGAIVRIEAETGRLINWTDRIQAAG
ncbi:hypothetical protein [Opitutus terrae]|uniref:Uncharacterized protein n=1 Tax=Opitutus terrae (strain DSM 11246 / JCM 15787 / PB90-1) TaxID=452637 RepID=B1ZQT7_OPITP|nr:hypothetical protein [Opitutus terrae]ACB77835.1 hypothetical protein Oter_4564 [Opitutus terrae PB90-1]